MRGKVLLGAAVAVAIGAPAAQADSGQRAELDIGFTTQAPGTSTGANFHIVYKDENDPNGKPKPLTDAIFDTPAGTRFDGSAVPRCDATDDEIRTQGRGACPPESEVGRGSLVAVTGFGPPADPVMGDITVFNGGDQLIEIVTQPDTDAPLGFDRLTFEGDGPSRLHAHPPATPGGPPEGRTSIRQIDIAIPERDGFVTTPPSCPAGGRWSGSGTFSFLDGVTETVPTSTPCRRASGGGAAGGRGSIRVRATPRRVATGRRIRVRVQVRTTSASCRSGVRVRLGTYRARTGRGGRATIVARLTRGGRRELRAYKRGCGSARAVLRAG
jgi:hypothetical protein